MLIRVQRIRDYGVYRSFDWPLDALPDFSRRNLIYGWNYSGKTTLSRIVRSIEQGQHHPDFATGRFQVVVSEEAGQRTISSPDDRIPFAVRVFNSDYVDDTLHWKMGVEPILILGQHSRELQERRERLQALIAALHDRRAAFDERRIALRGEIEDAGTRKASDIRRTLGVTPFNRAPHLETLVNTVRMNPDEYLMQDDAYHQQDSVFRAEQREPIATISSVGILAFDNPSLAALFRATAQQNVIEALKADRDLESWVEEGLSLHEGASTCGFCGGPLLPDLLTRLSEHFSDSLKGLKLQIDQAVSQLEACHIDLPLFDDAKLYEDLRGKYRGLRERAERCSGRINMKMEQLQRELQEKKTRVDESYEPKTAVNPSSLALLDAYIAQINGLVETHNKRVGEIERVKAEAKSSLLLHEAASLVRETDLNARLAIIASLEDRADNDKKRGDRLASELRSVDEQISEETLGAERVNAYLRLFFGKDDIQIVVRDDKKYALTRSGVLAKNLSEGERTAISFSYFLAQLDAKDVSLPDTIVYIDDPVSSLDSNHLFNTFAVIKDVLADAQQLFVSTHDYAFFKLLKGDSCFKEFAGKDKRRTSLYYITRHSSRGAEVTALPELLRRYNSEYHYLFSVMYAFHREPNEQDQMVLLLPNIVRRILETYTSFRVPKTSMTLDQRLLRLCGDEVVAHRIYKFVNHQSHSDSLSSAHEFPRAEECAEVVRLVLDMMSDQDRDHCDGMIELCER